MLKAIQRWIFRLTHKDVDSIVAGFHASRDQLLQLVDNNAEAFVDLEVEACKIREEKIKNQSETKRAKRVATKIEELLA
jgi:hypothetical protein